MKKENKEKSSKFNSKIINIFLFLIIIFILLFIYSKFIGVKGLYVREYKIESEKLPSSFSGIKVVHFSDLLYGGSVDIKDVKKLVKKINELKPDIVVFTGNLIFKINQNEIKELEKSLYNIKATNSKYAIMGNDKEKQFNEIMTNAGFIILNNKGKFIYNKGITPIYIAGLYSSKKSVLDIKTSFEELDKEKNKDKYFKLVLMSEPDNVEKLLKEHNDIDLILSGNSLNGSIRIPYIGGIYKRSGSKKYYDSYYNIGKSELYISGGIGTDDFCYRFNNKPSINLYRFKCN